MASFALTFIRIAHRDNGTLIAEATAAFSKDFATFAKSNNRADIESAVKELKKSPQDKAYAQAVTDGYKAAALVTGYIGAKTGKFDSQSDDVKNTFNSAIERFTVAFEQSLKDSGAFVDATPKTDAEKAKAKEAKEAKAKEAKEAIINEAVKDGTLVRADQVHKLEDMGQTALIDALKALGVDVDALQAELTMVKAENDALKTAKTAKTAKTTAKA